MGHHHLLFVVPARASFLGDLVLPALNVTHFFGGWLFRSTHSGFGRRSVFREMFIASQVFLVKAVFPKLIRVSCAGFLADSFCKPSFFCSLGLLARYRQSFSLYVFCSGQIVSVFVCRSLPAAFRDGFRFYVQSRLA